MAEELYIKISIAKSFEDNFELWNYYDSIDEAIEALFDMKAYMDGMKKVKNEVLN